MLSRLDARYRKTTNGDKERGFRQIILGRDRLHCFGRQPGVERAHRRRIAGKRTIGERVDLKERDAHPPTLNAPGEPVRREQPVPAHCGECSLWALSSGPWPRPMPGAVTMAQR